MPEVITMIHMAHKGGAVSFGSTEIRLIQQEYLDGVTNTLPLGANFRFRHLETTDV